MWRLLLLCFIVAVSCSNHGERGDDEVCSSFRLKRFGLRGLNTERLRIGIIDSDHLEHEGEEFSLTIEHPGTSKIETKQATFDGVEDGVYKFQLNNVSRMSLAKKRNLPLHRFTFIYISITYEKNPDNANDPKFTELKIGKISCNVPEFKPKFNCPKLPAVCPSGLVGIVNKGFKLHLPVAQMFYFHLKIGFKNSQKVLKLQNQRNGIIKQLRAQASDCNETAHFIGRAKFKRRARATGVNLEFFTGKQNHAPQIEFIEYGNRMCKTSCGTDPCNFVEPTTTPAPATTTPAPATSTEAPVVTSTEAPVVTSTEAPVVTSTEAPVVTSTEAPVVTSTEAPVVTSTEAPVVSTESPTSTETPADEVLKELEDLDDEDFSVLDEDLW